MIEERDTDIVFRGDLAAVPLKPIKVGINHFFLFV